MWNHDRVTAEKSPRDQALDLLFYGPLGLALEARELLPKLAERGRKQLDNQTTTARMIGEFAVKTGRGEANRRIGQVQSQAQAALTDLGLWPGASPRSASKAAAPSDGGPASGDPLTPRGGSGSTPEPTESQAVQGLTDPPPVATPLGSAHLQVDPNSLAIPDYDSLAASQVVPRLDGLSSEELETVRRYEAGHRGRKTILGKIAQLQTG